MANVHVIPLDDRSLIERELIAEHDGAALIPLCRGFLADHTAYWLDDADRPFCRECGDWPCASYLIATALHERLEVAP